MTEEKRKLWERIGALSDRQARIALAAILEGKALVEALEIAESFSVS